MRSNTVLKGQSNLCQKQPSSGGTKTHKLRAPAPLHSQCAAQWAPIFRNHVPVWWRSPDQMVMLFE